MTFSEVLEVICWSFEELFYHSVLPSSSYVNWSACYKERIIVDNYVGKGRLLLIYIVVCVMGVRSDEE